MAPGGASKALEEDVQQLDDSWRHLHRKTSPIRHIVEIICKCARRDAPRAATEPMLGLELRTPRNPYGVRLCLCRTGPAGRMGKGWLGAGPRARSIWNRSLDGTAPARASFAEVQTDGRRPWGPPPAVNTPNGSATAVAGPFAIVSAGSLV